jgi:DNA polymerase V
LAFIGSYEILNLIIVQKSSGSMDMLKKKQVGGPRAGSGRPRGSGKYREATAPIRVPQSLVPQINDLLTYYLQTMGIDNGERAPLKKQFEPIKPKYNPSIQSLPLYATRVTAGFPSPSDEHVEAKLDLNQHLVKHPAATFFVRVEGDSMIGAGIYADDILVVDRSLKPSNGKIVIAILNGELTVKRLQIKQGSLKLLPENDQYPVIHITEEMNFSLWGVVTYVIHTV